MGSAFCAAIGAVSIQLVPVAKHAKVVPLGDFFLGLLDHLAFEFDDLAAFRTNKMIVVGVLDFVPHHAILELMTLREAGLHQEFHGSIHGGVANGRKTLVYRLKDFLAGGVALGGEKRLQNRVSLLRVLETTLCKEIGQSYTFDFVSHKTTIANRVGAPSRYHR